MWSPSACEQKRNRSIWSRTAIEHIEFMSFRILQRAERGRPSESNRSGEPAYIETPAPEAG